MPPCRVQAGETRRALSGITRCSCLSAAIISVRTATWSWADGSPPFAGKEVDVQTSTKDADFFI